MFVGFGLRSGLGAEDRRILGANIVGTDMHSWGRITLACGEPMVTSLT